MTTTIQKPPTCPECSSQRVWKDGVRITHHGDVQRYLCRECGYRFSETSNSPQETSHDPEQSEGIQKVHTSFLKRAAALPSNRQICVTETVGAKNLAEIQEIPTQEKAAGATKPDPATIKGILVEYSWFMKKEGYREGAIISYTDRIKHLLRKGAVLSDPEQTKTTIASVPTWDDGSKKCMVDAYDIYVKMKGLQWKKPHYKPRTSPLPFIPWEKEIDQLIAGGGFKIRVFLQGLKETGAGGGELLNIRWQDIDFDRKKLAINHPTKGHNPRILDVSEEWLRMLSKLPRTSERVWTTRYLVHSGNFRKQRRRLAREYNNPRLMQISFRTFRHWKGTTLYHQTKDPYYVKEFLGHKTLKSTEIYIHLEEKLFSELPMDYIVKRAVSVKGMMALAAMGFEKFDQVDNIHLYRKPRTPQ